MPYISPEARGSAPLGVTNPANLPRAPKGQSKPSVPMQSNDQENDSPQTDQQMVPRLSISTYYAQQPVTKIVEALYGVPVEQDPYTKEFRRPRR